MTTSDTAWLDPDRSAWREQLGATIAPDTALDQARDAWARAVWTLLVEPGDRVAGRLLMLLGADEALRAVGEGRIEGRVAPEGIEPGTAREALSRWRPRLDPRAVDGMFRVARGARLRFVTPSDEEWPAGVADLGEHAPVGLWARGRSLADTLAPSAVAVIGARAATAYGENAAIELASDLVMQRVGIVSGAAYGIDGAAHRAALAAGGATVAVLAGGVDRPYPAGHAQLLSRIGEQGTVVAEVAPGAAPTKWRFLQRNRLIAAMAHATIVVEAGWRSGSLNTAGHAAALGRPLGAVPGPITSATSAGCHRLLREFDATCITSGADVRELLGAAPVPLVARASEDERRTIDDATRVIDALSTRRPRDVDDIARRAGLSPDSAGGLLALLELEGAASREQGMWRRASTAPARA